MFKLRSLVLVGLVFSTFAVISLPVEARQLFSRSGFELTDKDYEIAKAAAASLYTDENAMPGDVVSWKNPESGNYGTIEMVDRHAYQGLPCVRLQHDIKITTVETPFRYILDRCQTADGEWKLL